MGKIKTLREDVYKKIAAGEVVERPLSVVKELVENSIDAGADEIQIDIIEGGKQLIEITDNGSGFDPDDIETAFKNHSTSKISELSDFNSLMTLGFRGEALPSIMEVSKIEIETSNNSEGRGVRCLMEQGEITREEGIACSRGTVLRVKDLFYNFPVRKKFLKSDRTEMNQIISYLEPVTLVHFNKSFELIHNNKTVFMYRKVNSLKERIYQVFGKDILDTLQDIDYSEGDFKITGLISRINTGISDKKYQYFFVNQRPVKEKTLIAALNNTYQKFLEKSRSPVGILMLEVPPSQVDVNIHPMKLEIKFEDSSSIFRLIKHGIEQSFGVKEDFLNGVPLSYPTGSGGNYSNSSSNSYGYMSDDNTGRSGYESYNRSYGSIENNNNTSGRIGSGDFNFNRTGGHSSFDSYSDREKETSPGNSTSSDLKQVPLFSMEIPPEEDFIVIGQYRNSYILIEKGQDLLLVDQHNAHERANFDALKREYQESKVVSVSPLFPVLIELAPSEVSILDEKKLEFLEKMGFRIESLGGNSFDIKSFPQILGEKNIKEALLTILHLDNRIEEVNFEDSVLAEIACKSAIKINHKLYPDQMKNIVKNLFKSTNPYFCPHKRPIIIEYSLEQIEKALKRR